MVRFPLNSSPKIIEKWLDFSDKKELQLFIHFLQIQSKKTLKQLLHFSDKKEIQLWSDFL